MPLALRKTVILPKLFVVMAIVLGTLFQTLGFIALFNEKALIIVIGVLMLQNLWAIAASLTLLIKKNAIGKQHTAAKIWLLAAMLVSPDYGRGTALLKYCWPDHWSGQG